ncbi:blastoderm-specific protein 25D [Colletes gigas]|uniref:blastoderm-specific protein 25D n=1 Tax=Colletes gigas TaxID=935657 RepID=UPI001C9B0E8D|nr:blastoderm-specific protein 25D [Colletes gigas]XP_043263151.1 blastoderm-specific protein 25D [Colletes gigas]XP_043263152.1 blastoderm-specific protein 25D [Colletes gigas]
MDEHNDDPYEQQLYAVFQSCLTKEETELQEDNWLSLCHKLDLTEQSEELKSCIQQYKQEKQSISFQEFRTALLTLLGKTQELITHVDKDFSPESQSDISSCIVDSKTCSSVTPNNSSSRIDILNVKTGVTLDENRLKCLWEKINSCLKENVDSATMYFITNCLGIPTLPKQIIQCIFEKLDQNCDGLISLDEFLIIFQNKTIVEEQLTLDKNNESAKELTEIDFRKRNFDIHPPRKTSFARSNTFLDTWKHSGMNTSLLTDDSLKNSEICLADLTTTLCDELKNFNDSLDHPAIRSHIMLLRDVLILYQEELHNLNLMIENINGEKEKLRIDIIKANERANTLAQEIDEQHNRQEEVVQSLRKQLEQRYSETVLDLSNQLSSERDTSANALKSKDDQIQTLQKENHEIRNKFVNTLQENQILETENENLRSQIEKLKQSNNELLIQMKILAAEHDESENIEMKHQQEVIYLVDRIKQIQSEAVLLRDQNDELMAELETLKLRYTHNKDTRRNHLSSERVARNIQSDEIEDKEAFIVDEEDDLDVLLKHSTSVPCISNEEENVKNCRKIDSTNVKNLVIKQLKNILASSNICTFENCVFRDEISRIIVKLQLNSNAQMFKEADPIKSIASEMETECEERTSESLRDFVVSKQHKNSLSVKRVTISNNNENNCDVDDNFNNQDLKSATQNKVPSLRDYPPRKEEHITMDHSKSSKEKEKITNEISTKINSSLVKSESVEDVNFLNLKLQELQTAHATEKKQLTEQCAELERSLDLLQIEYEECEDYWTAKLEEERQLFEQEQKISDEKFSELIAKMEEYEELISPVDKVKSSGRLSPIEEKINLEQQYLDLDEEFEKWKTQVEEEISQKDKEIKCLHETVKSLERPTMTDISVQVTDEFLFSPLLIRSNYVPNNSFNVQPSSESTSMFTQCNDNIRKLPEEFKYNRMLESSALSNDFNPCVTKENLGINNCNLHQMHTQYSVRDVNSTCKFEKPESHWKTTEVCGNFAKDESIHDKEYDLMQNSLKSQALRAANCQCIQSNAQKQVCCVNLNILHNLSTKLQTQERKKHQLQECFKQQQYQVECVLQHIISQHRLEVSELQYLLRNTQKRLQIEFQTSAEQAERLARTDILVKDLYIENACLSTNLKRLQQHYHMLTGLNAESTSI